MITTILAVMLFPSIAKSETGPKGTMTIFVIQPDRPEAVLKADAQLVADCINIAKEGDSIQAISTSGETVVISEIKKGNSLQVKRAKRIAITQLKQYFLELSKKPPSNNASVDIASALAQAMDRFNYSQEYAKMVMVLMTDGLQRHKSIDWRGYIPSDSWIIHQDSPFARIHANNNKTSLDVIMIPTRDSYVDSYHSGQIERWYSLLFNIKKARLSAFTFDHLAARELLLHGIRRNPNSPPEPINIDGPLKLTQVSELTMQQEQ